MTLSAIPTAQSSAPMPHSAGKSQMKPNTTAAIFPAKEGHFATCLEQSNVDLATPTDKSLTESQDEAESAIADNASTPLATLEGQIATLPSENTINSELSGNQFNQQANITDSEPTTVEGQNTTETLAAETPLKSEITGHVTLLSDPLNSMINAQDDPWLQQLDANRKALQLPVSHLERESQGGQDAIQHTDFSHLTGKISATKMTENDVAILQVNEPVSAHSQKIKTLLHGENRDNVLVDDDVTLQNKLILNESSLQKELSNSAQMAERLSLLTSVATQPNDSAAAIPMPAHGQDLLTALRQHNAISTHQADVIATPNTPLPLRHFEQSAQVLHEQVQFLLNRKLDTVEIRLDPPELGNLQIKLQINQDQAQVGITVHNTQARELLEQTLPRLREMLAQQGILLGQTQIQQQAQGQGHDRREQAHEHPHAMSAQTSRTTESADAESRLLDTVALSSYQVDYYA
ncbi:MAG: flagellar hook-length control protein FliK [Plesiomonas sp.]|uniref:flagellar hook-length control protein FliK n=1 Tax=Plesiomonas sp. TaxID=2486279 RepID=UPI003F37BB20